MTAFRRSIAGIIGWAALTGATVRAAEDPGLAQRRETHAGLGEAGCGDCHPSPHRADWKTGCGTCHSFDDPSFKSGTARTTPALHERTGLPLFPPHDGFSCTDCHPEDLPFDESRFRATLTACEGCHPQPHGDQFKGRHAHCLACHGSGPFTAADYTVAKHGSFPLTGAHRAAPCSACHKEDAALSARRYAGTPTACDACHGNAHRGQWPVKGAADCRDCHSSDRPFAQVRFDHAKTGYDLGPAHRSLACARCHPRPVHQDGAAVLQFKPMAKECRSCHGPS